MSMGGGAPKYYRCGKCDINLLHQDRFQRCPSCQTPCATLSGWHVDLLSDEETERLVGETEFARKLNEETEADREARQARAMARQRARADRSARFPEVIAAGGFTDEDRRRYEALEGRLPIGP